MKRFLMIIFLLSIFPLSGAMAGGRTIIKNLDKNQNITGYSVMENSRESHFSKTWEREGYSIHQDDGGRIDHYDRGWRRQGRSEIEDYEKKQNTE